MEIVRLLLEQENIEVNSRDCIGRTPLWKAGIRGNVGAVQLLLEKGAEFNPATEINQQLLSRAEQDGHTEVIKLLENHQPVSTELVSRNIPPPAERLRRSTRLLEGSGTMRKGAFQRFRKSRFWRF